MDTSPRSNLHWPRADGVDFSRCEFEQRACRRTGCRLKVADGSSRKVAAVGHGVTRWFATWRANFLGRRLRALPAG